MKKVFYLVAVTTFVFFSCKKEVVSPVESQNSFTLQASIEQLASPSKADMNASNQLVWATGDKIGIYIPGWGADCNQSFTLEGAGGSTTGSFERDAENGWFDTPDAKVAFFPWTSAKTNAGSNDNNVYYDNANNTTTLYFKLGQDINGYTSGQMLTPLVAPMTYDGTTNKYNPIEFKHAGAAIEVVVNNFPAGAKTLGVTVNGQDIRGTFSIDPSAAGTAGMAIVSSEAHGNDVWIHTEPETAERPFTFIFPVPELNAPKITFSMYDKNNVLVWSKTPKAQPSIARGIVLEMPAIDITPYADFNQIHPSWTVCGTANGTNWDTDFPMITDGTNTFCIAKGLVFADGGAFKVRAWGGSSWYPSDNVVVPSAGTYDIVLILDSSNWPTSVVAVPTGECPYPSASGIGKGNDLGDPSNVTGTIF